MDNRPVLRETFTGIATFLYLGLFIYIYIQLILVLIYNYKRWCYRTVILFLCIVWAGLRITLFSYYWCAQYGYLNGDLPELSRHVGREGYFILFSLPLYLQFSVLCLLVAYFSKILAISDDYYNPSHLCTTKRMKYVIIAANIIVFMVNLVCSTLIKVKEDLLTEEPASLYSREITDFPSYLAYIIYARVIINGSMFILLSLLLGIVVFRVSKTEEARLLLETENITQKGAVGMGILLVGLYVLRTAANILALIPSVPWVYDTDQVDLLSDSNHGYYMFLCVLLLWEYLPTCASVYFFRVKKPRIVHFDNPGIYPPIGNEDEEPLFTDDFDSCSMTFQNGSDTIPPWHTSFLGGDNRLTYAGEGSPGFRVPGRSMDESDRIYT